MKYILSSITLFLLASCGYEGLYPDLADGPSKDQKPSITLEEAKAEVAVMKEERDKLSRA
jgi:hypothetical protein